LLQTNHEKNINNYLIIVFSDNRCIVTRSKTGSSTPKQFEDSVTASATSIKCANSKSSIEESVYSINKDGEITRVTRSKLESAKSGLSIMQHLTHFRLGKLTNENSFQLIKNGQIN
jgi:hypothetical protein